MEHGEEVDREACRLGTKGGSCRQEEAVRPALAKVWSHAAAKARGSFLVVLKAQIEVEEPGDLADRQAGTHERPQSVADRRGWGEEDVQRRGRRDPSVRRRAR